jgi:uncharacterized membrane protein YecN with MAPEG domain
MDATQVMVTVLGFALVAGVLVFFFGPKKRRSGHRQTLDAAEDPPLKEGTA